VRVGRAWSRIRAEANIVLMPRRRGREGASNAQSELTPLERGLHALRSTPSGELDVRACDHLCNST
jgi:hypothetical protein